MREHSDLRKTLRMVGALALGLVLAAGVSWVASARWDAGFAPGLSRAEAASAQDSASESSVDEAVAKRGSDPGNAVAAANAPSANSRLASDRSADPSPEQAPARVQSGEPVEPPQGNRPPTAIRPSVPSVSRQPDSHAHAPLADVSIANLGAAQLALAGAASVGEDPIGARGLDGALAAPPMPDDTELVVCMSTDRVWGIVGPRETVTVTVDGAQMGATLSDDRGFFWTTLFDGAGDRAGLSGGEQVSIFHNGVLSAALTLHAITGTIDTANDTVHGRVDGASTISVTVYAPGGEPSMTSYRQNTNTDGAGNYTVDFAGVWDFVLWDEAVVAYGEGVEIHRHVYPAAGLMVRPWPWNWVFGPARPATTLTATLYESDGVTVKGMVTTTADARTGFYFTEVPADFDEADIVAVELAGGMVLSRTVDHLTMGIVAADDVITGEATPGATVRGALGTLTPLGWRSVRASTTAEASGAYTLEFAGIADIMPGDDAAVLVADDEGDELNVTARAPLVHVNQTWNQVSGWAASPPGPLAAGRIVTLALSSTGEVYTTEMGLNGQYTFGEKEDGLPDIVPGDVVTVESEGYAWQGVVAVMTMTVAHDLDADEFTGTIVEPSDRVEVSGGRSHGQLYPLGGGFATLVTATSPFAAAPPGFDVNYDLFYDVLHRTADDNGEMVSGATDGFGVAVPKNQVEAVLGPPGTAYTFTLYDTGWTLKAQLIGTSDEPVGHCEREFGEEDAQVGPGDWVQVQSAAGFSQSVQIPDFAFVPDVANDVVYGSGPPNTLLFVEVADQAQGFVPVGPDDQFAFAVDQLQDSWGDGDLEWGIGFSAEFIDENRTWVFDDFWWPMIFARYRMDGGSEVWGVTPFHDNPVHISVTHPVSGPLGGGTAHAGGCDWCGPDRYALELPDGTVVPNTVVTADFGDGYVDSMTVVTVTGEADPDTDVVTITAPAGSSGGMNAFGPTGDWNWYEARGGPFTVGASGVLVVDLGADGYDVVHGTSFNVSIRQEHNHYTQYNFWLPVPDLRLEKSNTSGHARPGGVVVYDVRYGNSGSGPALETRITDTLPMYTSYAGDTSGLPVVEAGGVITWDLGEVAPGDQGVFMVTLNVSSTVPTGSGVIDQNCAVITTTSPGDPDPGDDGRCTLAVDVWEDEVEVGVGVWAHPDDPTPGEEFEYQVGWCNNRGAAVGPLWLTDTLPVSTTFVSWQPEHWDNAYWTEVVTTGGVLALYAPGYPGDSCDAIKIRLLLDPSAQISSTLYNHVELYSAGDVDPENNERTNQDAHVSPPRYDMRADKWLNGGVLVPGGRIEYGIKFDNQGNAAVHAWLTDTLPQGASFARAWTWGPEGDEPLEPLTVSDDAVVWDLGVVGVRESWSFNVLLDIGDGVGAGEVLSNCASVGLVESEDTPLDNRACVETIIYAGGRPNLYVFKEAQDYRPGHEQIQYHISFGNYGSETVYNVTITDTFPISTTYDGHGVDWGGSQFTYTVTAEGLQVVFERIEPGWGGWIDLPLRLDDPGARLRWYTNIVEIDTPPGDPTTGDNVYVEVVFSGGEVDWLDLEVGGTMIWGQVPEGPVTITTPYTQEVLETDGGFDWNAPNPIQPGDTITVAAGRGTVPVIADAPFPFDAHASSITDTVWGQVDHLDQRWVEVDLHGGPGRDVQTDGDGNFSASFVDVCHAVARARCATVPTSPTPTWCSTGTSGQTI